MGLTSILAAPLIFISLYQVYETCRVWGRIIVVKIGSVLDGNV